MAKEKEKQHDHLREGRTFVGALTGQYDEIYKRIYSQPRVFHSQDSKAAPSTGEALETHDWLFSPEDKPLTTQAFEVHFERLAPGEIGHKHGHMNSAVLYALEGKGYEIHDGERLDWQAGDLAIVRNASVHQHFNADSKKQARILIIKSKPLFLFFHLIQQREIKDWKVKD